MFERDIYLLWNSHSQQEEDAKERYGTDMVQKIPCHDNESKAVESGDTAFINFLTCFSVGILL